MRLTCGHLEQCGVWSECLSMNFGSIKIRPVFFSFTPSFLPSNNMSAPAKSTTPIAPAVVKSKDWMKAATPELLSSSEDELSVLDAKAKERRHRKQVRREERQHWEAEEKRARKEVERKAREEVERKAREEVERKEHEQVEKERAESQARAKSQQRKAAEEAAKQRAVEIAAKQKTMVCA